MHTKKILDKEFVPFISQQKIEQAISKIAQQINEDYKDKCPIFLPILNGAFIFTSDLIKQITIPCEVCFVKLASYQGTSTTHKVVQSIGLEIPILNRHIIILDDILDTGTTLNDFITNDLNYRNPASIRIVVMLDKYQKTKYKFENKITGLNIKDKFVVGYGLDYNGMGRNMKEIYQLKD